MPIVRVTSPRPVSPRQCRELSLVVTESLGIPAGHCWVLWEDSQDHYRPQWEDGKSAAPIIFVWHRQSHAAERIGVMLRALRSAAAAIVDCDVEDVYCAALPIPDDQILVDDRRRDTETDGRTDTWSSSHR